MPLDGVRFNGFEGRVAVVTGAARGIGRAIADSLAAQGARTALLDINEPNDISGGGDKMMYVHCDVADETSVEKAFTRVEKTWGTPSILVNNAGVLSMARIEDTDLDMWNRTMAINLTGAFLCSKRVIPAMREAGYGRIVTIGSSAGKTGGARMVGAYGASKAGVMALAKAIASENADRGITSNAIAPALIDTDMVAGGLSDLVERIPVGRLGTREDVAYAVLYLASEDAGYITAEVMDVNGGFLID